MVASISPSICRWSSRDDLAGMARAALSGDRARISRGACSTGEFGPEVLDRAVRAACDFPVPVRPLGDGLWLLELFHGPTLAFKDVGARVARAALQRGAARGARPCDGARRHLGRHGRRGRARLRGRSRRARGGALPRRQGVAVPGSADGHHRRQRHGRARERACSTTASGSSSRRCWTRTSATLRLSSANSINIGRLAAADVLLRVRVSRRGRAAG